MKVLVVDGTFEHWRVVARELLVSGIPPREVSFSEHEASAFLPGIVAETVAEYGACASSGVPGNHLAGRRRTVAPRIPAPFFSLAERVALHRDRARWGHLYAVLWRVAQDGADALLDRTDADISAAHAMAEAVRKDVHRFHALVRFRCIRDAGGAERYVAFHRPDHTTLRAATPFFVRRFGAMLWSILTPDASAHWDRSALSFGPGVPCGPAADDRAEELWRAYYASTFNPDRVNLRLMRSHLPERVRAALPEARNLTELLRGGDDMAEPEAERVLRLPGSARSRDRTEDPAGMRARRG